MKGPEHPRQRQTVQNRARGFATNTIKGHRARYGPGVRRLGLQKVSTAAPGQQSQGRHRGEPTNGPGLESYPLPKLNYRRLSPSEQEVVLTLSTSVQGMSPFVRCVQHVFSYFSFPLLVSQYKILFSHILSICLVHIWTANWKHHSHWRLWRHACIVYLHDNDSVFNLDL